MIVREKSNLPQWFKFFLVGIIETSKSGIKTFDNILQLQKKVESEIQKLGSRATKAKKVIDYLYQRPIIDADKVGKVADISMPSSYKLISDLEKMDILKEVTGGKRGRTYVFDNYLRLFR
jgi:Fic family protein